MNFSKLSLNTIYPQKQMPNIDENSTCVDTLRDDSASNITGPVRVTTEAKIETTTSLKSKKRPRSPLPLVEASGPRVTPSAGGFTGGG